AIWASREQPCPDSRGDGAWTAARQAAGRIARRYAGGRQRAGHRDDRAPALAGEPGNPRTAFGADRGVGFRQLVHCAMAYPLKTRFPGESRDPLTRRPSRRSMDPGFRRECGFFWIVPTEQNVPYSAERLSAQ